MFKGFGTLRETAKKAPQVANSIRIGQAKALKDGCPRPYVVLDSDAYVFESQAIEAHVPKVRRAIQDMKKDGSRVFGVDLMGQGRPCIHMGCDEALALCLETAVPRYDTKLVEKLEGTHVNLRYGDIFDTQTAKMFVQSISEKVAAGEKLGLAYFRPLAGIWNYERTMTDFAFLFLYKHYLKPIYGLLEENGAIFAELTFQMHRDPFLAEKLSAAVREKLSTDNGFNLVAYSPADRDSLLLIKPAGG